MSAERDRMKSPSINFPKSQEEAFQAIVHQARKALFVGSITGHSVLAKIYTTDAGLGTTRTQQQADWLNNAQDIISARLEDVLDGIDYSAKDDR